MDVVKPWTMTVPEAGKRYFGMGRDASYQAAARGEIPVIKVGRLKRVPILVLERQLGAVDVRIPVPA